ncbi:hypothetical protein QFC21_005280 [Naganishia friedmannii]|uniref:Uncharacterized protein n=1 Tax=Naganishia friedmannii TaxID=89922 RepID=A0ACC2VAU0_9TREE|nr:hypothetical protein QFC21_005280 [Naganishia friedmannii]
MLRQPTALIIVDVQNDFLPPTGSLAVPQGREVLSHIYKFLEDEEWVRRWDVVVATQVPGTLGAEIEQGLKERLKPWLAKDKLAIARKGYNMHIDAFSAFEGCVVTNANDPLARSDETNVTGPDLGSFLLQKGIKRCVVLGLATDYCVAQTTLSAVSFTSEKGEPAFKTFVYTPAARGVDEGDSKAALASMRESGAVLIDDEVTLKNALES